MNDDPIEEGSIPTSDLEGALRAAFGGGASPGSGPPSVLDVIAERTGFTPRVLLYEKDPVHSGSPLIDMRTPETRAATIGRGNYQILGEISRGGMGVILKGRDMDLGRDVAIKAVLEEIADDSAALHRFVEEAQIGGQLQHPGIVPIHELGLMADGRPYFAMRLIEGRTLSQLLADRASPADDRHRMLSIFHQVCQTIAYAHARGVIHRDLKPSNVMVGTFGEVQVVDWGLAKVLTARTDAVGEAAPREAGPRIETVRSGGSSLGSRSRWGTVMGTPAYMPPEQAAGRVEELDERSDVFSLGAILCALLTGEPPYTGEASAVKKAAAAAELDQASARLADCGVDDELVQLCRGCLGARKESRPRNAEVVARELGAHLASVEERARTAQIAAAETRVRAREERKLVFSLAGAVIVVVAAALGIWLALDRAAGARRAKTDETLVVSLAETTRLRGQAQESGDAAHWQETLVAMQGAEALSAAGEPSPELAGRVDGLATEIRAEARRAIARAELEASNAEVFEGLRRIRTPEGDRIYLHDWEKVATDYGRVFLAQGLELDRWSVDEAAQRVRQRGSVMELAAALDEWASVRRKAGQAEAAAHLVDVARAVDDDMDRTGLRMAVLERDVGALRRFAARPGLAELPPSTLVLVGNALGDTASPAEAIEVLREAVLRYPDDYLVNASLARWLREVGPAEMAEAPGYYRACLALRPGSVELMHGLGLTLDQGLGRSGEAEGIFEEALRLAPDDAHLWFHLGFALARTGRGQEALGAYRESIRLDPSTGQAYNNIAVALDELGRFEEAIEYLREGIRIAPEDSDSHYNLGRSLYNSGNAKGAIAAYQEVIRLQPTMASAHYNLACIHEERGEIPEALMCLRATLDHAPEHQKARWQLGVHLCNIGEPQEALELLREGVATHPDEPRSYFYLANALEGVGEQEEAMEALRTAVRLEPRFAEAHYNLGFQHLVRDELQDAEAAFRKAVENQPEYPTAHCNLGLVLESLGRLEEALDELRIGHEQGMRRDGWPYSSAEWIRRVEISIQEKDG